MGTLKKRGIARNRQVRRTDVLPRKKQPQKVISAETFFRHILKYQRFLRDVLDRPITPESIVEIERWIRRTNGFYRRWVIKGIGEAGRDVEAAFNAFIFVGAHEQCNGTEGTGREIVRFYREGKLTGKDIERMKRQLKGLYGFDEAFIGRLRKNAFEYHSRDLKEHVLELAKFMKTKWWKAKGIGVNISAPSVKAPLPLTFTIIALDFLIEDAVANAPRGATMNITGTYDGKSTRMTVDSPSRSRQLRSSGYYVLGELLKKIGGSLHFSAKKGRIQKTMIIPSKLPERVE